MGEAAQRWNNAVTSVRHDPGLRPAVRAYGMVALAALAIVAVLGLFAAVADVDGGVLSREPQITLEGPVYAGVLSNLGALVWMVGATMAALGWVTSPPGGRRAAFRAGTVVGSLLLFDDFFLFHDWLDTINPNLDEVVLALYLPLVAGLIIVHRRALGPIGVVGLVAALGLFAASAGLDEMFNGLDQLVEDGVKFLGICAWSTTWTLLLAPWMLRTASAAAS